VSSTRKSSLVAGIFFIVTFVTSIPAAFILYHPVLNNAHYIVAGAGTDNSLSLGAFLEVLLVLAGVGTAVTLFPILKRQNEGLALGYVAARILESTVIVVGIISLLSIATLRQHLTGAGGAEAATLITTGKSLVAVHNWTFLMGPGLLGSGIGNGMLLGWLMYRSGLVPRRMAVLGLVGGPLVVISGIAVMFGLYKQTSGWSGIATLPEFAWELSLGIFLIVKGFKPSSIVPEEMPALGVEAVLAAP
jgi:hypothetical protein